jgi:hypothetical protein
MVAIWKTSTPLFVLPSCVGTFIEAAHGKVAPPCLLLLNFDQELVQWQYECWSGH